MIYELEIPIGQERRKAFLQDGFFEQTVSVGHFHSHRYAEVHLIAGGRACFEVGDRTWEPEGGSVLLVPRGVLHRCLHQEEGARHTAFQIDCEGSEVCLRHLPRGMAEAFLEEIDHLAGREDYASVGAYMAWICARLATVAPYRVRSVTDYGFLIHEFFSLHYKESIRLGDLARELHLSERQTERLVLSHTKNTFRGELARVRLTIAEELTKHSPLSMTEIARAVGYESYAGFWKARKQTRSKK